MNNADYIRDTIDVVKQLETRFFELGKRLYTIKTKELWRGTYDSYWEFLLEAKVNPTLASRLTKIHEVYIVLGKQKPKELANIGYSNLYEAIPLVEKDGVEKTVVKASTLSRSELVDEIKEDKYGEAHVHQPKDEVRFALCECGKFIRV